MKSIRLNLCLFVCLCLFAAVWLARCTSDSPDTVSFAVGGAPSEIAFWEKLVVQFTEETGIDVSLVRQPTDTDQRRQSLVTALRSKKRNPDVFLMDVAWVPQFAASGWLSPLSELISSLPNGAGPFFSRIIEQADTYNDTLIALPVYVDGGVLYYRTDLLDKYGIDAPPRTWAQLREYSLTVMEGERADNPRFYGFVWQGAQYEGLVCTFLEFAASNGGGLHLSDSMAAIDIEENREAVAFMRNSIHDWRISPPNTYTEMKEEEVRTFFQNGNALFERNWPYAWQLHQSAGSPVAGKTGVTLLPHFEGHASVSTLGGWHIGMSRFTDASHNAWRLIRYITSYEVQKRLALELGWNPGREDVYEDSTILRQLPHFAQLQKAFATAIARPPVPYYSYLSRIIQRHVNAALAGQTTVDKALREGEQELVAAIKQYEQD